MRDSGAGEQDVDRSAGLRQKVQVHFQRWIRCHGDRVRYHVAKNQMVEYRLKRFLPLTVRMRGLGDSCVRQLNSDKLHQTSTFNFRASLRSRPH